jgi:periplasmic divalent cation tolerance protein
MAAPLDPNYRNHLQALSDMFAASIPARMAEIAEALAAAEADTSAPQLERLQHALHTVAGSAGSFGFGALGTEARRLEQAVRGQMGGVPGPLGGQSEESSLLAGESGWASLARQIHAYLARVADDPRGASFSAHD